MRLTKSRASYQFTYSEPGKFYSGLKLYLTQTANKKSKLKNLGKYKWSCYLDEIAHFSLHLTMLP